ncbi:MAG TPA: 3-phosphoshikimate 1-carboxyvinyltransferase [Acidimicrobiales bacterium]|nr:3-phosphoshikimate 1-carboxyvinyltransferase [Acidimicrobiales bacterium]
MNATLVVEPLRRPPDVRVVLPGSKSLTNRALVCAATADGDSTLENALLADDTEAMIGCLRALGIHVAVDDEHGPPRVAVRGTRGLVPAGPASLHARLSGTTSRFVAPLLACGTGRYVLDGDPPLRARPMGPLVDALRGLGASVDELGEAGHLPIAVVPGDPADGAEVELPGDVSSQFLSGLLLVAPLRPGGLAITLTTDLVSRPYVEMTLGVMSDFGVTADADMGRRRFSVPRARYRGRVFAIEPDASAASYFFAAAAVSGGRVRIDGLSGTSRQGDVAFVDVLERMGARVERGPDFVEVRGTGALHGVDVDLRDISDTAQTLAAAAVFADSPTRITGIGFIRGKETDRIGNLVRELQRCGIEALEEADGLVVHPGAPQPARIETYDDHRMAMSFAVIGLRAPGIEIADPGCVAKTFPEFWSVLDRLRL